MMSRTPDAANAQFLAADFAGVDRAVGRFEYIVARGVYFWDSEQAKQESRRFVDRHLAPGGLVCISYNAMPGRLDISCVHGVVVREESPKH
jgi:hypothetical protein